MYKKLLDKYKSVTSRKLNPRIAIIAVGVLAVIVLLIGFITQPVRSVASYCKVYKEQNDKLANSIGNTYGVAVFTHPSSKAGDFIGAFTALEQVSPDSIQPDVKTLLQIFQTINDDPSRAASAELSGMGAESSVKTWTEANCKINIGQ